MHRTAGPHEIEQGTHVPSSRRRPVGATAARVHQDLHGAGHEAVVHEEVLVNVQTRIATLEIAGAVADHAMAQRQVLGPRRCPDGVRLHEAEEIQRALERGWRKEATSHREAAQVVEGHRFISEKFSDSRPRRARRRLP